MNKGFLTILALVLTGGCCWAAEPVDLKTETGRINYSVGYQIGGDFKRQGVVLDSPALVQGIEDALQTSGPQITPEVMENTLKTLKQRIDAEQKEQRLSQLEKYRGEGRDFLAANAKSEGVVTLPSGLQYRILQEGLGPKPTLSDTVTVHYRGTQIDGSEFDSSYRRKEPATFPLTNVIPGWQEALQLMREGGRWKLFIPADLAFGERGPLAERVVIYEIELLRVNPQLPGSPPG
jgi:FKBP-type peptidyl-prolyl cis-trans isomerase FklB